VFETGNEKKTSRSYEELKSTHAGDLKLRRYSLVTKATTTLPYVSVEDLVDLQVVGLLVGLDDQVIHDLKGRRKRGVLYTPP